MTNLIFSVSKVEAASDQLDWAIRLFLDHKAYVPAITLSHAAETILGDSVVHAGGKSALFQISDNLSGTTGHTPEKVRQFMNDPANWLKHWKGRADSEKLDLELETLSIQYITRAAINLHQHDQTLVSEMPRFWEWIKHHRPDIDPERGKE